MDQGPGDVPITTYLVNVGIALVGAAVRFMREWRNNFSDWKARRVFFEALMNAFTAGFTGLLTFWLLYSWKVDPFYTAFGVGVMGHMGPEGIALLTDVLSNGLRAKSNSPTTKDGQGS